MSDRSLPSLKSSGDSSYAVRRHVGTYKSSLTLTPITRTASSVRKSERVQFNLLGDPPTPTLKSQIVNLKSA